MGLAWQQGPLAPGAIGHLLVPGPLPERLLFAERLRRRMLVRFGEVRVADSEDEVRLHEPGHYPVAYFPLADVSADVLDLGEHTTNHRGLGTTSWYTVQGRVAFAWRAMDGFYEEDERIVWYVPRADVNESGLTTVEGQTFCPYKGVCIDEAHL